MPKKRVPYAAKEANMTKALEGLADGTYTNFSEAARATGVDRVSLTRRFNGGLSRRDSQVYKQSLSPDEEVALTKWIECLSCTGNPVHHSFLRDLADEIRKPRLEREGLPITPLGKHWITRFLKRNPSLQSRVAKSIEAARKEVTEEQIQKWFAAFKRIVDEHGILPENIYNMDETG
jgi:hypothetical protein